MNEIAEALGLVCAADIGLLSIEYTCSDGENTFAQTLTLTQPASTPPSSTSSSALSSVFRSTACT